MLTIGVDAHKRIHAAVALDAAGREVGHWRGPNTPDGWQELATWAATVDAVRVWGVEGAWQYGRGLAQHLVAGGESVVDVNPRWTAGMRRRGRRPGKNDRLDAQAVAQVVRQDGATLPRVSGEDETAILAVLTQQREAALADATRLRNQLHQLLVQLDPTYQRTLPALTTPAGISALLVYQAPGDDALTLARSAAVRRLAQRLELVLTHAAELKAQLQAQGQVRFAPLLHLCGVGPLTAAMLAGLLGPGQRFATDAQLAAYAGVAPVEASSGEQVRHRLNRGGQRQLNAIIERIVLTQERVSSQAQAYLAKRRAEGKTRREAIRALKRYIVRAIWRLWQDCQPAPITAIQPLAA